MVHASHVAIDKLLTRHTPMPVTEVGVVDFAARGARAQDVERLAWFPSVPIPRLGLSYPNEWDWLVKNVEEIIPARCDGLNRGRLAETLTRSYRFKEVLGQRVPHRGRTP